MANRLVRRVAWVVACLLVPAVGAVAQQTAYLQSSSLARPAAVTLAGTYASDTFFPIPLSLTITGMDAYGNLVGSIGGFTSARDPKSLSGYKWATWRHVFGADGTRAVYRAGKIEIVFPNGTKYLLQPRGSQLVGRFATKGDERSILFIKME